MKFFVPSDLPIWIEDYCIDGRAKVAEIINAKLECEVPKVIFNNGQERLLNLSAGLWISVQKCDHSFEQHSGVGGYSSKGLCVICSCGAKLKQIITYEEIK